MKIEFERTGGFTGMRLATTIDIATLPVEEKQQVEQLLTDVDFFALPTLVESAAPGMDQFQYTVTITPEDADPHTVQMGDAAASPDMQVLLRQLTMIARQQPLSDPPPATDADTLL